MESCHPLVVHGVYVVVTMFLFGKRKTRLQFDDLDSVLAIMVLSSETDVRAFRPPWNPVGCG
jgi:hypothetical protein